MAKLDADYSSKLNQQLETLPPVTVACGLTLQRRGETTFLNIARCRAGGTPLVVSLAISENAGGLAVGDHGFPNGACNKVEDGILRFRKILEDSKSTFQMKHETTEELVKYWKVGAEAVVRNPRNSRHD